MTHVRRQTLNPDLLHELLPLLADGHTYQQMANRIGLGVEGVRHRIKHLYRHLEAENAAHAVAIGYRLGLLAIDDTADARVDGTSAEPRRHTEMCAIRTPPVCDCGADRPTLQIGAA